jgi:hypothetical protein
MMRIKTTISCSGIAYNSIDQTINTTYTPKIGDVALFEVLEIGKHKTVQCDSKLNVTILPGDRILAAFGNRYATSQFEGYIPEQPTEILDILGAGGAIGIVKSKNADFDDIDPTKLRLIGFAKNAENQIVNTVYNGIEKSEFRAEVPKNAKVLLSIGSTMDSGKTTTAAFLSRGIALADKKVAFIKLTGTCYTKDKDLVYDCGAQMAIDFLDAGYPSTFMLTKEELLDLYQTLLDKLLAFNPDYIVMEIADGILQRETEMLLRDHHFMSTIHQVVLSCGDSLAAFYGISFLEEIGKKPIAIAGLFTKSPLLIEEVELRSKIPVLDLIKLASPSIIRIFE